MEKNEFLVPLYLLINFEIRRYYQNLPNKIKDGAYVINLDEYADVGTHWISVFC